jgi:hypothetical protein
MRKEIKTNTNGMEERKKKVQVIKMGEMILKNRRFKEITR